MARIPSCRISAKVRYGKTFALQLGEAREPGLTMRTPCRATASATPHFVVGPDSERPDVDGAFSAAAAFPSEGESPRGTGPERSALDAREAA
jgi:hypothetical protein